MKILFITTNSPDYLSDSLLIGLKQLYGNDVIDFPKNEVIYSDIDKEVKKTIRGGGFSLYNLNIPDTVSARNEIREKVKSNYFDLIIFGSIQRQFGLYLELFPFLLKSTRTVIVDGEDSPSLFPYSGSFWRNPYYWFLPSAHKRFLYFKREWTPETIKSRYYKLVPTLLTYNFLKIKNLRSISFSIPEEKIVKIIPEKTKLFGKHIVDEEVASKIPGSYVKYAFNDELEYYNDLQKSKFGITTKRSGWDCLRHYEIAANGSVICFKDLDKKPSTCAPHGLNNSNCLSYKDYQDLMQKVNSLTDEQYINMQNASLKWIKNNTTINIAEKFVKAALENFNQ